MKFLIFIALVALAAAHSTHYNIDRNETCYNPEPAPIFSWHIHMLYWHSNANHSAGALGIRERFMEAFKHELGAPCDGLFHQGRLCMFEPESYPAGPFVTGQWSVYVPNEYVYNTTSWIMQRRGKYDVLVHPNTGCELEDHTWWAFWGGAPWEIDLSAFSHDKPWPWYDEKSLLGN